MARKAIVGLGNPGARYAATRHNVGFMLLDRMADRLGIPLERAGRPALWGAGRCGEHDVMLAKPMLFMNRSGEAMHAVLAGLELDPRDVLVAHDEIDLPFGRVKLKRGGGTAGHRGLESIVGELGSADFCRLRIGVGRPPPGQDATFYVLSAFAAEETTALASLLDDAVAAADAWLSLGIEAAMNRVNSRRWPGAAPGAGTREGGGSVQAS